MSTENSRDLLNDDTPEVLDDLEGKELPLGYEVKRDEDLLIELYLSNEDSFRETMSRESGFSFPAAAVGTVVAGPIGTASGHIAGAVAGLVRHNQIHGDEE